jgi:transcription elongation factor
MITFWMDLRALHSQERQLMKYFKTGDHVQITAGKKKGVTGMVLRVDQQIVYAHSLPNAQAHH